MSSKPKLLLIDADYAPYAFGSRPDFDAIVKTTEWLEWLYDKLGTRNVIICVSGRNNFRYRIATIKPYKANRANKEKPESYQVIRDYLLKLPNAIEVIGAEADDIIIMLKRAYEMAYDVVMVSDDKDFLIETGTHFRHSKNILLEVSHDIVQRPTVIIDEEFGNTDIIWVTEYYGDYMLYYQMLIGDSADNIPGVPGIGKSNKIFKEEFIEGITVNDARAIVWREYLKYYKLSAVDAYLEQYRLLRLMKDVETLNIPHD